MTFHGKPGISPLQRRWRRTIGLALVTIAALAFFALVVPLFAGPLNAIRFAGFPLGYYMAAQGSLLSFLALTIWFIRRQERLDRDAGVAESEPLDGGDDLR